MRALIYQISKLEKGLRKKVWTAYMRNYWKREFSAKTKKRVLTREQRRAVKEFFEPIVRKKIDCLYHDFYTQKTGAFRADYIPDDIYYAYIDPYYNDWEAAKTLDNKCYYRMILSDVQQPELIALRMNGYWYVEENGELHQFEEQDVFRLLHGKECFIKAATNSEGGHGVVYLCGKEEDQELKKTIHSVWGDAVVQSALKQHLTLSSFNPSSVNTIRVLSFLDKEGNVRIISAILRIGVGGSKVDNASSGGITCGITDDGKLKKYAFSAKGDTFDCHPDSGISFEGIEMPQFAEIRRIVERTHLRFSHFRLLSWDFAVSENNEPILIEVNLHYGELDFHQLNNGPLFGENTRQILEEVFSK